MSFDASSLEKVYGLHKTVCLFFITCAGLIVFNASAAPAAETDTSYSSALITAAREKALSGDHYWDVLLHYKRAGAGRKSLVDDPKFFLAPRGRTDPEAELEATIISFFKPEAGDEEHPQCRFVARYAWLKDQLNIDETDLLPVACPKLDEALSGIKLKSAVLVFPAAHGNGPASMFGHTLIRIDSSFRSDLLAHAVNYAAKAEDSNGFVYAFKGIFGYYKGFYAILPYYEKVKEYNGMEHRDMWEYSLNLSEGEIRRMVLHIWELKDVHSNYYFFDENCSFDLLFLLEAARPSARLTDMFWERMRFWVIPVDTIRAVRDSGMIAEVKYRPSQATRILAIASKLEPAEQQLALDIAENKELPRTAVDAGETPENAKKILNLSAEYLQYRYSTRKLAKEEYLKLFLPVLQARSLLGSAADDADNIKPPVQPEQGHLPGKASAAMGYQARSLFTELEWRAAYHDLLDRADGYVEGAAINFFDLSARYYFKEDRARLQSVNLIDIVSISPRDRFFKPVSWKMLTGFNRALLPGGEESLVYRINPGGGLAYRLGGGGFSYFFIESDLNLSNKFKDRFSFGIGPSAGFLAAVTDAWKLDLSAQSLYYELGERRRSARVSFEQNFRLTTNSGLRLSATRQKSSDIYQSEVKLTWNFYM